MAHTWLLRFVTLAAWLLAAASIGYWSLQFVGSSTAPVKAAEIAAPAPLNEPADLARVFGPPVAVATAAADVAALPIDPGARFELVGVVADRASSGVALIAVDGKAARPYRVGSQIEDEYTLKSVAVRSATLAPMAPPQATFTLELATPSSTAAATAPRSAATALGARVPNAARVPKPPRVRGQPSTADLNPNPNLVPNPNPNLNPNLIPTPNPNLNPNLIPSPNPNLNTNPMPVPVPGRNPIPEPA